MATAEMWEEAVQKSERLHLFLHFFFSNFLDNTRVLDQEDCESKEYRHIGVSVD